MSGTLKRGAAALLMLALLLALLPLGARADGAVHLSPRSTDIPYPVTGGNIYFDAETGTIRTSDESVTEVDIPEEINGVKVTAIGDFSFGGTDIRSILIPEGVVSIGRQAFDRCTNLTSVSIPSSVTEIGSAAFFRCDRLSSISLPDNFISIGSGAFLNCTGLVSISIPNSVTSIGSYAFSDCSSLTSVTIPDGVMSIGDDAFSGCSSLTSITIPDSVTSIGNRAFYWCSSLTSVTIGSGVTSIGDDAFSGCTSLTSIAIDGSTPSYRCEGGALFSKDMTTLIQYPAAKGDTSYVIPEDVSDIVSGAFSGCSSLISISIPNSVTSIGIAAFVNCNLTDIYYGGSEADWAAIDIQYGNDPLLKATIHYNSPMPEGAAPATAPAEESAPAAPAEEPAAVSEKPVVQVSTQKVAVDGVEKVIDHYNIDGDNYFKLRDLACILMGTDYAFDVGYDAATRTIAVTTGGVYTPLDTDMLVGADMSDTAVVSTQALTVDGASVSLTAFNIDGSNYFRLRDLAPYIGFGVDYDAATRTALIITK